LQLIFVSNYTYVYSIKYVCVKEKSAKNVNVFKKNKIFITLNQYF